MLTRAQGPGVYYLHTEAEKIFWRMASANGTFSARGMQGKYEELGSDPWYACKKQDMDPRTREETRVSLGFYSQSAQPISELQVQRDPVSKDKVESDWV